MHDLRGGVWWADGVPRYRRAVVPGGTLFFTVVTYRHRPLCADPWARPTVLSIDDDPDISQAIQIKLAQYGVDVLRAFNGEQGYSIAVEQRPAAIITDLVLPEAEGAYMFRRLRSNDDLSEIPIIVLTGNSYPAVKQQMLALGVEGFLTKPLVFNQLLRLLREHIEIPKQASSQLAMTSGNPATD